MDDTDHHLLPETGADRARTLVIRCWFEREAAGDLHLRGTLRDLARGRSVPFDGLSALVLHLRLAIGEEPRGQAEG